MKKLKIKNNKKNIFFVIVGRVTTILIVYGLILQVGVKILEFVVNNCITTL